MKLCRDRIGWRKEALRGAPKGDKRKVRLAARLRRETTMSLKWIAERLAMGSWTIAGDKVFQGCRMPGFQRQAGGADCDSAELTD